MAVAAGISTPAPRADSPRVTALDAPSADWSAFVAGHPEASIYHTPEWLQVARVAFGYPCYFLEARDGGDRLTGVLPLVRQRSLLLGSRLVSLPYCNYGGVLAADSAAEQALLQAAAELARRCGCRLLELRQTQRLKSDPGADWRLSLDKVTFELDLPGSVDLLLRGYGAKLRSQVKRAEREGLTLRSGPAVLDDFYRVFAENMRDLGTPVYPLRFFQAVLHQVPRAVELLVLDLRSRPVAAGLLLHHRGGVELPWAACTSAGKGASVNMRLYFEMQSAAIRAGASSFDFGRCSVDSGTYRFKAQWGAERRSLFWYRWSPGRASIAARPDERPGRLQPLATALWQRLPLPIANRVGPWLSPWLPW